MRTGSSVRSTVSFFFSVTSISPSSPPSSPEESIASTSSSRESSPSSPTSSFSTMLTPMSFKADITSSICSDDIWSCGRAELSSS
jgi:hypothetical protein